MSGHQGVFKRKTCDLLPKATDFVNGLFKTERNKRNIERLPAGKAGMAEETGSNYQNQQQFISDSPWSARELMDQLSVDTNNVLGDKAHQALSIDESSNGKAGKHSVGVSHQYNGNKGKNDNCQTGVYASLGLGNKVCVIGAKLFLPDEWIEDPDRCAKAGIPKGAIVKKTKLELGLELIVGAIKMGSGLGGSMAMGCTATAMRLPNP